MLKSLNEYIGKKVGYNIQRYTTQQLGLNYREALKNFIDSNLLLINGLVLEIGPGTWDYIEKAVDSIQNAKYFAIDPMPRNNRIQNVSIYELSKEFHREFDTIIACDVFEHLKNPFKAIDAVIMQLKVHGWFIASVPFKKNLHGEEYGDYWRITRQGWKELLKQFSFYDIIHLGDELFPKAYFIKARK